MKSDMQSHTFDIPLGDFLTYRINVLSNLLNRQSERFLKQNHGIAIPDWRILFLLATGGPMSVRDLSGMARMDKALVSRVVSRLTEAGFVAREANHYDGRLVEVSITETGMSVYNAVLPHAATRQSVLLGTLDPDELDVLERALDKLTEFVEEKGDDLF